MLPNEGRSGRRRQLTCHRRRWRWLVEMLRAPCMEIMESGRIFKSDRGWGTIRCRIVWDTVDVFSNSSRSAICMNRIYLCEAAAATLDCDGAAADRHSRTQQVVTKAVALGLVRSRRRSHYLCSLLVSCNSRDFVAVGQGQDRLLVSIANVGLPPVFQQCDFSRCLQLV